MHSHLQSGFTTLTLASASPELVVSIRPPSSVHAQPCAYWSDGTSDLYNATSGRVRCSQDSHKASDRPTLLYFPLEVAASIKECIEVQDRHFSAKRQELLPSQAPHFLEFSVVSDRMHGFTVEDMLALYHKSLLWLAYVTMRCTERGPDLTEYECEQSSPSSISNECLTDGVCTDMHVVRYMS